MMEVISDSVLLDEGSGEGSGFIFPRPVLRNINDYPVCVVDEDCQDISSRNGVNYR